MESELNILGESGLNIIGESGLKFFGKMSAANSHEIKNALAVINENAGLLSDLVAMADQGVPLSNERLGRLAEKIREQVFRADEIAKSTNRFAHSVDNMHGPADLGQSLALIKTMAMRFATQRHIDISIKPYSSSISVPVPPFLLLHLLWLCLSHAMESTNAEKTIQIETIKIDQETIVRFGPLSHLENATVQALCDTTGTKALLTRLGGKIAADLPKGDLVLTLQRTVVD